eukprot:TRINITY_DN6685_c0_g1_i2.p1 TRINITY_DN6685_c0_g1~~TRINITY_DN6685_c0_g1_i2.p1  ORF type:complete len:813 (+),score=227.99 TRINITY_DN6685_c0_g1_i2:53-2491(+)
MPKKRNVAHDDSAWISGISSEDAIFRNCKEGGLLSFEVLKPSRFSSFTFAERSMVMDSDGDEDQDGDDIEEVDEFDDDFGTEAIVASKKQVSAADQNKGKKEKSKESQIQENKTKPAKSVEGKEQSLEAKESSKSADKEKKGKNKENASLKRKLKDDSDVNAQTKSVADVKDKSMNEQVNSPKETVTLKKKEEQKRKKAKSDSLSEEKKSKKEESLSLSSDQISPTVAENEVDEQSDNETKDFSAWGPFHLHPLLMKGIQKLGFTQPTPIQQASLEAAINHQVDVIGAAETGSGKTLAFGIPILHHILTRRKASSESDYLSALIIAPTRELSLQIVEHLEAAAQFTDIHILGLVGGISHHKQERLLSKHPNIIVGTPGRLWELIQEGDPYLSRLEGLQFFVLDEADRMVAAGHFKELDHILNMIPSYSSRTEDRFASEEQHEYVGLEKQPRRQTFVFSATLTMGNKGREEKRSRASKDPLQELLNRIDFQRKTRLVQLVPKKIVVERIDQSVIRCLDTEKDYYLAYILTKHPGKTVIFCNSVDCVLRLYHLFPLMRFQTVALHAQMQQRQRMKHLERFVKNENGILIATDVAARGLDIKDVKYVIHYQIPRSAEIYVHRSGRTARAMAVGQSIMMVSPEEQSLFNKIAHSLQQGDEVSEFPVDKLTFPAICRRVNKARLLDRELHKERKTKASHDWMKRNAEAAELEVDYDFIDKLKPIRKEDEEDQEISRKKKAFEVVKLQQQLDEELNKPLVAKGVSTKYVTSMEAMGLSEALKQPQAQIPVPSAAQALRHKKMLKQKYQKRKEKKAEKS